jgi:hypothetical protein
VIHRPARAAPGLFHASSLFTGAGAGQVFTAMCGSCANECAYKACFITYQARKRGGHEVPFTGTLVPAT